jgi:hypothetical protein
MEISYGKQILINDINSIEIDLFFCVENHEKRSYTLLDKLQVTHKINTSIVLCYKDEICNTKKEGVKKIRINNHSEIYKLLDKLFKEITKESITIVIDYSCMTKSWYYSIILYLKNKKIEFQKVSILFSYTPSKYNEPKEPKPNKEIGPLPGKYIVPTDKPKALIVCLGYEQNKAEGIIEHLDPKLSYLFYTKPASENKFVKTLEINNFNILEERSNYTRTYPFNDLLFLERELTSLYFTLRDDYSIVIAPLGPKPFTFISMLMSIKYPDIDIWRVGSGNDINEYYNEPINDKSFIICEVLFEQ